MDFLDVKKILSLFSSEVDFPLSQSLSLSLNSSLMLPDGDADDSNALLSSTDIEIVGGREASGDDQGDADVTDGKSGVLDDSLSVSVCGDLRTSVHPIALTASMEEFISQYDGIPSLSFSPSLLFSLSLSLSLDCLAQISSRHTPSLLTFTLSLFSLSLLFSLFILRFALQISFAVPMASVRLSSRESAKRI